MEVPRLETEVWRPYRGRGVVVIGVAIDQSPAQARAFRQRWELTFPIWVDRERRLYDRYAAQRLPLYSVLLDQRGRIVVRGAEMYLQDFTARIRALTGGSRPAGEPGEESNRESSEPAKTRGPA